MLQKREETAMELANTYDKGRLIDIVKPDFGSAKPNKRMVLLIALFLGAALPVGVIFLLMMFKTKIDTCKELESMTKLPLLTEISGEGLDEAIRNLRTNLLLGFKEDKKTIMVASQNDGDGKTFIAKQLTESLNTIGKKCALINADLRSQSLTKGQYAADILAGDEFANQITDAKSVNDYVIIDTPALSKYSDVYQVARFADVTLYVVKAGKTQKSDIESLNKNKNIPNPVLVLNK